MLQFDFLNIFFYVYFPLGVIKWLVCTIITETINVQGKISLKFMVLSCDSRITAITNLITSRLKVDLSSHNVILTLHDDLSIIATVIFKNSS